MFEPPPPNRRGVIVAVLAAVTVLAIAGVAVLLLVAKDNTGTVSPPVPTAAAVPTTFITEATAGGPTNVKLTDQRGTTVTLSWTDPTNGTVSFVVTGKGPGTEVLEPKVVGRGVTTVTYAALSADRNYCFVVHAIYSADRVANAPEICTKR